MENQTVMTHGNKVRNVFTTPTTQAHGEPVILPDHDTFGQEFPREYAPEPVQLPGEPEPVIIPPPPAEENHEATAPTVTTQGEALAAAKREVAAFEAEDDAAYEAYLIRKNKLES